MSEATVGDDVFREVQRRRWDTLQESGLLEAGEDEPLNRLAELTRELLRVDTALVSLVAEDRQVFRGRAGAVTDPGVRHTDLDRSYCRYPVATGEPFTVPDARDSALLRESPAISDLGAVSYAGVPLSLSDGTVLGTLCVLNTSPRDWSDADLDHLRRLAELAEAELERQLEHRRVLDVMVLVERLEEPVSELGDTVRTVATLVERPGDPRLPRVSDLARHRLRDVETVTEELASAVRRERAPDDDTGVVDVVGLLRGVVELASAAARPGDLQAALPDRPILVQARPLPLSRRLTLAATTLLHHLTEGRVILRVTEAAAGHTTVSMTAEGTGLPASELLHLVGRLSSLGGEGAPLDVRYAGAVVRVRSELTSGASGPSGTHLDIRLPAAGPR